MTEREAERQLVEQTIAEARAIAATTLSDERRGIYENIVNALTQVKTDRQEKASVLAPVGAAIGKPRP